jgi:putative ABC transport system permease protein
MNRVKLYLNYATRSLRRGGQRTLLAIFCIAVGVMAIVSLELVGNMVNTALTGNVRAGNGGDVSVRNDITPFNAEQLDTFAHLQADATLSAYTAVVNERVQSQINGQPQSFFMYAVDPAVFPLGGQPDFKDPGNGTISSTVSGNTVVVTDSLLSQLGLSKGDSLTIHSPTDGRSFSATIGGVIYTTGFFDQPEVVASLDMYKALPSSDGLPPQYNAVFANVPGHTDANQDKAKSAITQALPTATVTTTKDALQQNQTAVQNLRYFLEIVGLLALLIGGVGIINTMQVLLRRRHIEIAMLKTSGYRQVDLYGLFGVEAGLLGLLGGVIGALAGILAGLAVKTIVENVVMLHLDYTVDPFTVLSGVAIGFFTALIFGVMPIVQASQVRPQAVLRDLPEGSATSSILLSIFLLALLCVLFFILSAVILNNVVLALFVVGIGAVVLGILSAAFSLVVYLISRLPVPETLNLGLIALVAAGLVVFGGLTWLSISNGWSGIPIISGLFTALSVVGLVVVFLPRTSKSNVKMALRNIGRQRTRTVSTLVALFIGVFSIGLILALGIGIRNNINSLLATSASYNSYILVGAPDKTAVDTELSHISGIKGKIINTAAQANPVSVDGRPIGPIIQASTKGFSATVLNREELISYVSQPVGYDLAAGSLPSDLQIVTGHQDSQPGRNLNASDAGTKNVIMPLRSSIAPLNLKLGSQIVMVGMDGKTTTAITVVGFYKESSSTTNFITEGGMISDNAVPIALSAGHEFYIYSLNLDPSQSSTILNKVQAAVPNAETLNLAEISNLINSILNNLIIMLTAIASLAMIAGVIIIANAVALAMLERRRELGILKSVGHTSRSVLSEVLLENGVIGFTGGVLAMILVALALFILGLLIKSLNFGVETGLVLAIIFTTSAVCMIVAAAVAWNATRVRPLEVLRYE